MYKSYQEVKKGNFGKDTRIPIKQTEKLINFFGLELDKLEIKLK